MASRLLRKEKQRINRVRPKLCPLIDCQIDTLSEYFAVLESTLDAEAPFWFRGHASIQHTLVPSALRGSTVDERERTLGLVSEFRRVAEMKLERPPASTEQLKWLQIAQHYGLPTRLLDWTESAIVALHFACASCYDKDGAVYVLNASEMNGNCIGRFQVLDGQVDVAAIQPYFQLGATERVSGHPTIAIAPAWNSERIMIQKGAFTLHGDRHFGLNAEQAPPLVVIPILRERKRSLQRALGRVGIDEMTVFPELEHACAHIKRKAYHPSKLT